MHPADEQFSEIYRSTYPAVLAYCARRLGRLDAEDATMDVFAVLWRRFPSFDRDHPLPWLYRVAHGVVRNRQRTVRRKRALGLRLASVPSYPVESPDAVVVQRERDRTVRKALMGLSTRDQEILRLAAWEGLKVREIAAVVGCSEAAAEQRLRRATKRLGRVLPSSIRLAIEAPTPIRPTENPHGI
ncbi:MAG: sigma-70 family RNA polymerase sigma factor [Armatimonadetes bacterium]|nr:MAG: sigma-70 family RNA polymerase sigma factor [Armatimonadota bacterium]